MVGIVSVRLRSCGCRRRMLVQAGGGRRRGAGDRGHAAVGGLWTSDTATRGARGGARRELRSAPIGILQRLAEDLRAGDHYSSLALGSYVW
jgi:hypothetical protein